MPAPFTTPVASSTPYDDLITNLTASYGSSVNSVQTAIEALKQYAEKVARFCVSAGFDGGAGVGRYLEFFTNLDSSSTPFIVPKNAMLKEISISASSNSTGTATIRVNGVSQASISLSNSRKNAVSNLSVSLNTLDAISIQVTSGSISKPMVSLFIVFI
jgi:hypothetical protein